MWKLRNAALLGALLDAHADAGRTQGALARRAGVSTPYLSNLKAGRRDTVSPVVAVALARALGIDPRVLFVAASSNAETRNVA